MKTNNETKIVKDFDRATVSVARTFSAPLGAVWSAFTESKQLDKWWGPIPWRCETQFQHFEVGGHWHYAMVGPEGEKAYGRMNYTAIDYPKGFSLEDLFSDEHAGVNPDLPASKGKVQFTETADGTSVEFSMVYETAEGLQTSVDMGFEEGISICFEQLADLIER